MESEMFKNRVQRDFIESVQNTVELNKQFLNSVFEPNCHGGDVFSVVCFAPLWETDLEVFCKYHQDSKLEDGGSWLNTKKDFRTLYDMRRKVLLISRSVVCPSCENPYKSHDQHILDQLPPSMKPCFILFHKEGVTQRAVDLICNYVANGSIP